MDFIADSTLVIHNAPFDMKFLNHELDLVGKARLIPGRDPDVGMSVSGLR